MVRKNNFINRNASTILTCLSAAGVVATTFMAIRATPKALKLINEAEKEKGEKLSKWETVKTVAPTYLSTALIGTSTIVCIFGTNTLTKHQQASLASAYAFLDQSYKKYRRKVVELYGEETHNNVVNAIAIEKAKTVYPYGSCFIQNCAQYLEEDYSEPILFYEMNGETYFEAPLEQVLLAEYHLNRDFSIGGNVSLSMLYELLGLDTTDYTDSVGWDIGDGIVWIDFNHKKVTLDDGLECYIIEMPFGPSVDYKEFW